MLKQAEDFQAECDTLYRVLAPLSDVDLQRRTLFKEWTINDVVGHLHVWNIGADLSLCDEQAFKAFMDRVGQVLRGGGGHREINKAELGDLEGQALVEAWQAYYIPMSERFGAADPKRRVKWAGPDMSVRSSITARLMETWAHGQEIFDVMGLEREEGDSIKNVVVMGVNTFAWTFVNRKLDVPKQMPHVVLKSPTGERWVWGEPSETERIEGSAVDFARVVTQVRNVKDTTLSVQGEIASRWMEMAQCFAGPPEDPPAPGSRFRQD